MGIINHTHHKLKENLKIENRNNIEQNIWKPKVQCWQNKMGAQNDKYLMIERRSNESIICGSKTFRKDSKLYRLCETEWAELFLRATKLNMDAVFTKVSIFDKPVDLFAADIMSHRQCMNR